MTNEEAKKRIKKLLRWYLKEEPMSETMYEREAVNMALEALSEPTIPLSVIEDIKGYILKQMPEYDAERECTITLIDIKALLEFIDRKVKEIEHE